jgi:Na+/melibiose symporter-like transporter
LFLLYVGDVLKSPDQAGLALVIYFAAGVLAAPFWIWVSKRVGKHRAWIASMIWACVFFMAVPFLGPGDAPIFLAICVLTGISFGADLALPASMQADVIDLDAARSGGARAGLYFALWAMASKLALAVAVGVAFPILDWAGYAEGGENSGSSLLILALLYGFAPVLFKVAAIIMMRRYPLTAARHARLRGLLEARRRRKEMTNASINERAGGRISPAVGM